MRQTVTKTSFACVYYPSIKLVLIFFVANLIAPGVYSQAIIKGQLLDQMTRQGMPNVEVKSSLSNTLTDSNGYFKLQVLSDDIISFKKFGYKFDTIHLSKGRVDSLLTVYMEPLGRQMQNVIIRSNYSAYQLDSIRRRVAFDEGRSKRSFVAKEFHTGFGLVFNLDRLTKSRDKNLQKQKDLFEKTEQWAYVRYRFPDTMVQFYTGLAGDSLRIFMKNYTPSYEWLRAHTSEVEIVFYINDKIKLFRRKFFQPN